MLETIAASVVFKIAGVMKGASPSKRDAGPSALNLNSNSHTGSRPNVAAFRDPAAFQVKENLSPPPYTLNPKPHTINATP